MQAVLISSKDNKRGREEAEKIFKGLKTDKFDISTFEFEKAVGIPDIREIQKKIYLRPFKSDVKAILIDVSPGITVEAQNALLKTLEESPEDTIIVLLAESASDLLPTILSRCKVIELSSKIESGQDPELYKLLNSEKIGDRLKLAQDLAKDKDKALIFLESSIINLRENLILNYKKVKLLQKFHTIIKGTNVNLRLALENLFINL